VRLIEPAHVPGVILEQAVDCLHDVPPAAVVGCNGQCEARIRGCAQLGFVDERYEARLEAGEISHHLEADIVLVQLGHLALQSTDEKLHQKRHLVGRPPPVLAAEREQGQILDARLDAAAGDPAYRL
jgi:hypothetical protein